MTMRPSVILCVLAALSPGVAACDEFRCGQWLVSSELSVAELLAKCGEPSSRKVSTQEVRAHALAGGVVNVGTTTTEVWRYDRGSKAQGMIVTVVDGKIQGIESGK
jgi:hypothetical protein